MAATDTILQGVSVNGKVDEIHRKILTPQALAFLALLHRSFNGTRKQLLERRKTRQAEIDRGVLPDFLPETKHIRENATWKGAVPAPGLVDRRVEITGPTDRKMVVNALNAEVYTYMADFEGEFFLLFFSFFFLLQMTFTWGRCCLGSYGDFFYFGGFWESSIGLRLWCLRLIRLIHPFAEDAAHPRSKPNLMPRYLRLSHTSRP